MDMISNLPLELRIEIFKRFVLISKDMKTELQNKWFNLFYEKAWKFAQDPYNSQCIDILFFLKNTVIQQDIKLTQFKALDNRKDDKFDVRFIAFFGHYYIKLS